jgi:hypothetical protein
MPSNKYEIIVNNIVLFTKYTQSETNRLSNLLNERKIKHEIKVISFI